MKFSSFYAFGGAMGFTPAQIDACSLWELRQMIAGARHFHNPSEKKGTLPSDEEFDELQRRYGFE